MRFHNYKYIYSIINNANGKRYIGQTDNYILRWETHLVSLRNRVHNSKSLQKDFNKYGETVFSFELLEIHTDNDNSNEDREFFWIKHFKTYTDANGYNGDDPKSINYISRQCNRTYRAWFYPKRNGALKNAIQISGLPYDYIAGFCRLNPGDVEKILNHELGVTKHTVSLLLECLCVNQNERDKYFTKKGKF